MENIVLELTEVRKTFYQGDTALQVLCGANLTVSSSEIVALIGPSGSGKSTLLQIAGLLEKAEEGVVSILGSPVNELSDHVRTKIRSKNLGFVYQYHHLLAEFNARENIVLPQLIAGKDKNEANIKAMDLLGLMNLSDRATHRPARMSGGEQQRVAFARALANKPQLLLADEPTGSLDPSASEQVISLLLEQVRTTGIAALIATHNPNLAMQMDRIVRLENGKLVAN